MFLLLCPIMAVALLAIHAGRMHSQRIRGMADRIAAAIGSPLRQRERLDPHVLAPMWRRPARAGSHSSPASNDTLETVLAFSPFAAADCGRLFTAWTAPLLHGNWLHVIFNAAAMLPSSVLVASNGQGDSDSEGNSSSSSGGMFSESGIVLAERLCGPFFVLQYTILFVPLCAYLHYLLCKLAKRVLLARGYLQLAETVWKQGAIGFSGVLFAWMTVVELLLAPQFSLSLFGAVVPISVAPLGSMLLVQILVRRVSFMGHLAGILAGYAVSFLWSFERGITAGSPHSSSGMICPTTTTTALVGPSVTVAVAFWSAVVVLCSLLRTTDIRLAGIQVAGRDYDDDDDEVDQLNELSPV
jgi:membrane associated rhomboid family serine protease